MLQCFPLSAAWDTRRQPEKCIDRFVMDVIQATINLVFDIIIYSMPLILVLKSSINKSMKSESSPVQCHSHREQYSFVAEYMVTIFGIGMVTILAAAGRLGSWIIFFQDNVSLAYAYQTPHLVTRRLSLTISKSTWYILSISSIVEIVTGIIATSIPILAPLAKGQWQNIQKQYSKRTATTEQTIALTKREQRRGDDRI